MKGCSLAATCAGGARDNERGRRFLLRPLGKNERASAITGATAGSIQLRASLQPEHCGERDMLLDNAQKCN